MEHRDVLTGIIEKIAGMLDMLEIHNSRSKQAFCNARL